MLDQNRTEALNTVLILCLFCIFQFFLTWNIVKKKISKHSSYKAFKHIFTQHSSNIIKLISVRYCQILCQIEQCLKPFPT